MSPQANKRANDDSGDEYTPPTTAAPAKKPRTSASSTGAAPSESLKRVLALKPTDIQALGLEEARTYLGEIQSAYIQLAAAKQAPASSAAGGEAWTEDKIKEKAEKIRQTAAKEIKKQMKWQPSCKKGTTKWSYVAFVPNEDVYRSVFNIQSTGKKLPKTGKMSVTDFQSIFGYIQAPIRFGELTLTGENVNIGWKPEDNEFRVSGTYGLYGF